MQLRDLIKYLEEAEEMMKVYGFSDSVGKQGLYPIQAVSLTVLQPNVLKRVAPQLADKDGTQGWTAVSREDGAKYANMCIKHGKDVRHWVEHYLGKNVSFPARKGILLERARQLKALL